MGVVTSNSVIRELLQGIIKERDQLRLELRVAKVAIVEMENQNIELDRLLSNAHALVMAADPRSVFATTKTSWIGMWESSPTEYPSLAPVEELFRAGQKQRALNSMPSLLKRTDLDDRHRVNGRLLYAAMLQSTGSNLTTALSYAEEALRISYEVRLHELVGKANFWRALCHLSIDEFANAKWCLALASHLSGHTTLIEVCKRIVEQQLICLPEEKRSVTPDFKFFCTTSMEVFVRSA
ncbi:MAG: hypothetical protein Q9217_004332 [Psora testacea]